MEHQRQPLSKENKLKEHKLNLCDSYPSPFQIPGFNSAIASSSVLSKLSESQETQGTDIDAGVHEVDGNTLNKL